MLTLPDVEYLLSIFQKYSNDIQIIQTLTDILGLPLRGLHTTQKGNLCNSFSGKIQQYFNS